MISRVDVLGGTIVASTCFLAFFLLDGDSVATSVRLAFIIAACAVVVTIIMRQRREKR